MNLNKEEMSCLNNLLGVVAEEKGFLETYRYLKQIKYVNKLTAAQLSERKRNKILSKIDEKVKDIAMAAYNMANNYLSTNLGDLDGETIVAYVDNMNLDDCRKRFYSRRKGEVYKDDIHKFNTYLNLASRFEYLYNQKYGQNSELKEASDNTKENMKIFESLTGQELSIPVTVFQT